MMYWANKFVGWVTNPLIIAWGAGAVAFVLQLVPRRGKTRKGTRWSVGLLGFALVWLWIWGSRAMTWVVGGVLERPYLAEGRMREADRYPVCNAIVLLGGGVNACTNTSIYADLDKASDRAYFAAQLWKAGRAPVVVPSSRDVVDADVKVVRDFGVPESAIKIENEALNTEENAGFVEKLLGSRPDNRKKVLLVTSAWHMKRSVLMMRKYAPNTEVIEAPCDFEALGVIEHAAWWQFFYPTSDILEKNSRYWHEWVGYWGYRLLRR